MSIDPAAIAQLQKSGITRARLFDAIKLVSETETSGCWGGASGNFDEQIVSVGALQWNYGQGSLPSKLRRFRTKLGDGFDAAIAKLMPVNGKLIFSTGCLQDEIQDDCKKALLSSMNGSDLSSSMQSELDALFETDDMIQIQMDSFVALVEAVQDDLKRLFPDAQPSPRMIQWAIDSKVQMSKPFPGGATVERARKTWATLSSQTKTAALLALVDWYSGSSFSVDQGGTIHDRRCNVKYWRQKINSGVTDEQAQLLNLSYLASRQLGGKMEGYWQALTFQRHAKIILGVGSVAGNRLGIPAADPCTSS